MKRLTIEQLTNIPVIDLGDIYLRAITLDDYKDLYEYGSDDEVTKTLTWNSFKNEEEAVKSILNVFLTRPSKGIPAAYCICLKENDKMIGTCVFYRIDYEKEEGEIGYVINRKYWGLGYMTKACKAVIEFGIDYLGLKVIAIRHAKDNIGSKRVIEKCGFLYENEVFDEKRKKTILSYKIIVK